MLSAICFNLDQSKILSSGNGLNWDKAMHKGVVSLNIPSLIYGSEELKEVSYLSFEMNLDRDEIMFGQNDM